MDVEMKIMGTRYGTVRYGMVPKKKEEEGGGGNLVRT